jgi:hypothetical protein
MPRTLICQSRSVLTRTEAVVGGVGISAAGNDPTWEITVLVYLPHSSVAFSGAVNKSSNGASCSPTGAVPGRGKPAI